MMAGGLWCIVLTVEKKKKGAEGSVPLYLFM